MTNAERLAERRLSRGIAPSVPHSLPYRALAFTCGKCGGLVSPTSIRRDEPRTLRHHECDNEYRKARLRADEQHRQRMNARAREDYHGRQSRTADGAHHRGDPWTGAELEVAARTDLTTEVIAHMLGRTVAGVMWARKMIRTNPQIAEIAGVRKP